MNADQFVACKLAKAARSIRHVAKGRQGDVQELERRKVQEQRKGETPLQHKKNRCVGATLPRQPQNTGGGRE